MHRQWDASSIGAIAGMENDHVAKKQAPLIDPFSNAAGTAIHRCSIRNRRARCTRGRTAHASYPVAHSLDVGTSTRGHDSNAIKGRESGPTLASCSRAVSLTTAGDRRTLDAHPPPPPSARRTVATGGAAAATARRCRPRAPTTRGRGGGGGAPRGGGAPQPRPPPSVDPPPGAPQRGPPPRSPAPAADRAAAGAPAGGGACAAPAAGGCVSVSGNETACHVGGTAGARWRWPWRTHPLAKWMYSSCGGGGATTQRIQRETPREMEQGRRADAGSGGPTHTTAVPAGARASTNREKKNHGESGTPPPHAHTNHPHGHAPHRHAQHARGARAVFQRTRQTRGARPSHPIPDPPAPAVVQSPGSASSRAPPPAPRRSAPAGRPRRRAADPPGRRRPRPPATAARRRRQQQRQRPWPPWPPQRWRRGRRRRRRPPPPAPHRGRPGRQRWTAAVG